MTEHLSQERGRLLIGFGRGVLEIQGGTDLVLMLCEKGGEYLSPHKEGTGPDTKPRLLIQVRNALRSRHYSPRTEKTYIAWIKRYIYFHDIRHPDTLGENEINDFLTHLAVVGKVSASTQNQALSALLFLYRHVLGETRAKQGAKQGVSR